MFHNARFDYNFITKYISKSSDLTNAGNFIQFKGLTNIILLLNANITTRPLRKFPRTSVYVYIIHTHTNSAEVGAVRRQGRDARLFFFDKNSGKSEPLYDEGIKLRYRGFVRRRLAAHLLTLRKFWKVREPVYLMIDFIKFGSLLHFIKVPKL